MSWEDGNFPSNKEFEANFAAHEWWNIDKLYLFTWILAQSELGLYDIKQL